MYGTNYIFIKLASKSIRQTLAVAVAVFLSQRFKALEKNPGIKRMQYANGQMITMLIADANSHPGTTKLALAIYQNELPLSS